MAFSAPQPPAGLVVGTNRFSLGHLRVSLDGTMLSPIKGRCAEIVFSNRISIFSIAQVRTTGFPNHARRDLTVRSGKKMPFAEAIWRGQPKFEASGRLVADTRRPEQFQERPTCFHDAICWPCRLRRRHGRLCAKAATFGNPDEPAQGAINAKIPGSLTDPGPQNPAIAKQFPSLLRRRRPTSAACR